MRPHGGHEDIVTEQRDDPTLPPNLIRRNRIMLIGLLLMTLLPLGAAVSLYYGAPWMVEGARTNNGALLDPPGALDAMALRQTDGDQLLPGEQRRWRLLVFPGPECDEGCMEALTLLRQAHILLGRDDDRVVRLAVLTPADPPGLRQRLQARLPEMAIVSGEPGVLAATLADRVLRGPRVPEADGDGPTSGVLTVDPLGNVILYHALDQIGPELLSDLKQLLRLSNIG